MQTLRKKTSPLKYKNETSRFLGEGVSFKAKLIGILEVSEARGDRMCQEALADLKMAIRAAGEHKQRITINIAIDGLRLRDEKTGDLLYHHPVHKISFIAQDMTDSRAFGYIFGSPDKGHGFFGIKTDKAASQVVIAMRDLFQAVFALKKKEIELAKQHLDKNRYGISTLFGESGSSSTKQSTQDTAGKASSDTKLPGAAADSKPEGPAVADLVDLELELNSLQQGITQMERITPSDPFGSHDDPFGDSFTSYTPKLILPPPPSSGRERASRTSESGSLFSPKTPHTIGSIDTSAGGGAGDSSTFGSDHCNFSFSKEFNASSRDEPLSGDWLGSTGISSVGEKPSEELPSSLMATALSKEQQHEAAKKEILSQFDVFTDLDPLGRSTGKIKPYIDKKDFFQELKNPPKKVLNDLVSEKQPQETKLFNASFDQQTSTTPKLASKTTSFNLDPFGDDPFDKTDPFAEADFSKQDPFDTENFGIEFKVFNKDTSTKPSNVDFAERFKFPPGENLATSLSKSPSDKLKKHNTFDGIKFDDKLSVKMMQIHENCSLDMSSESECAPEPPPRPAASNLVQIKPPPLPPKKQLGDLCSKPPPRPPYSEDSGSSHYDYVENYETAPNSLDSIKKFDKSPPLPAPVRKSKFESDFMSPPQRPKKQFMTQHGWSSEEDYLTPISFPNYPSSEKSSAQSSSSSILLPPPQRSSKKTESRSKQSTPAPVTEPETTQTTTPAASDSLEGLDITLSQLTLTGLNEVASKLNIPASRLSNMTLVQLTEYISNFIRNKKESSEEIVDNTQFANFDANFANFNNFNEEQPPDRYAVFRELLKEEIKQTKIDTEPVEHSVDRLKAEEDQQDSPVEEKLNNLNIGSSFNGNDETTDRYAALRDIVVEDEIKHTDLREDTENLNNINEAELNDEPKNNLNQEVKIKNESNILAPEDNFLPEKEIICEYSQVIDTKKGSQSPKSLKSPNSKAKSPIPGVVTDVIQTTTRLTSGSLSDVVSGSSPEIDNTGSTSEVIKKADDATGESWAIFDQHTESPQVPVIRQGKRIEGGTSPWSSDSKEFMNSSPPEWNSKRFNVAGRSSKHKRDHQGGWWDHSAEPDAQYCSSNNRRSTDSYEDEYDESYDKPSSRRRRHVPSSWRSGSGGGKEKSSKQAGQSSSSRDASPWEEEPMRRKELLRGDHRDSWFMRNPKASHGFEKPSRRRTDSWDEEDDSEYDEDHEMRYYRSERHGSRETEKERHSMRERDLDRWEEDWNDSRRHRRRREIERDRRCCPDWNIDSVMDQTSLRYGSARRHDRKHEDRYYSREPPQESPWEDEMEDSHMSRYLTAPTKRSWKRPSSASEMDRKTGENRSRQLHHYGSSTTGGSDGERDRRYKGARRSRSRDSQFNADSGMLHSRHKIDPNLTIRGPHRSKHQSSLESEFEHHELSNLKKSDSAKIIDSGASLKRSGFASSGRKKSKDDLLASKIEEKKVSSISMFENNFLPSESESPMSFGVSPKFPYDVNEFETSEAESPVITKTVKGLRFDIEPKSNVKSIARHESRKATREDTRISPRGTSQRSPFEDDFSPPQEKNVVGLSEVNVVHDTAISDIIKEEGDEDEEEDSFNANNLNRCSGAVQQRKKVLNKNHRFSNNFDTGNLKKSDSVNIFARENDPFDDEFFNEKNTSSGRSSHEKGSRRGIERKWTEDFDDFSFDGQK